MMNNSFLSNIDGKNAVLKQQILGLCINDGDYSIADLSKEMNTSVPTITKLVGELIEDGFITEFGKIGTGGGRLAVAEEYLLLPIMNAVKKHSLNMINKDTAIKFSKLGRKAGAVGGCMLSRSKLLGLL